MRQRNLFLLCAVDFCSKYARVIPLKNRKDETITKVFQKVVKFANRQRNIIWIHKGSEFYDRSMKSCLQDKDVKIYSTHNKRKLVVAEQFIRASKNTFYKYVNSVSKTCIYRYNFRNNKPIQQYHS